VQSDSANTSACIVGVWQPRVSAPERDATAASR
jgi:hypothetical protein